MKKINIFILVFLSMVFLSPMAISIPLKLEVLGKIDKFTDISTKKYIFTEKDILFFKKTDIKTSTNWTNTKNFSGFLVADLLKTVGSTGTSLEFHCLDDYIYTIPISDVIKYKLIIAYEADGKRMAVRDLGPLALIYPRAQYPKELSGPETDAKFIWQINKIIIK